MNENAFSKPFAKYLANPRLVLLIFLLILVVGVNAFLTLPRTLNPEVKIPIVLVSTVLPGGSPGDVEQLVTIPLEDSIKSVQKVKTVQSFSRESVSIINVEFESGIDPEKARSDVKGTVDSVTGLPEDAQTPNVQKLDFENQPVWTFTLTTTGDEASLFKFAKSLQTKLKDLPEIDKADVSGIEKTEIEITIKPETFAAYGLNPLQLSQLVTSSLRSFPAGSVQTSEGSFSLSLDPVVVSVSDLRSLRLNVNSESIALSDIAIISEHPKPDQGQSFLAKPNQPIKKSLTFDVFKTGSVNINDAVIVAEELVNEEIKQNKNRFEVTTVLNTSREIDDQFTELLRDFIITVSLVVLMLFIFLGFRQALVSALSAPLSFLIVFAVMKTSALSLNFLTLFSLLLALGLLVDDTVVVISAMTSYWRNRKVRQTPLQTGLLVWRDFLIPIFTTTITTIWAFLPLLLSTGIIGEFIKSIPVVVSTALFGSFFVSIFIIMPLMVILFQGFLPARVKILVRILFFIGLIGFFYLLLPKDNNLILVQILVFAIFLFVAVQTRIYNRLKLRKIFKLKFDLKKILNNGLVSFERIDHDYKNIILKIISKSGNRKKAIAMVLIFSLFSFALFPLGFVKNEFFPKVDTDLLYMSLEMPFGTNVETNKKETLSILEKLKQTPGVETVSADIGRSFSANEGIGTGGVENTLFTINLPKKSKKSGLVAEKLREEYAVYTRGNLTVQEVSGGPPVGADVQIKLLGDDLIRLESYSNKVEEFLKSKTGLANVSKSVKPGTSKIVFVPDLPTLSQNNIEINQIGLNLRLLTSGLNLDKNKFEGENEEMDITLRLISKTPRVEEIGKVLIPIQSGALPLNSLGSLKLEPNPTLITREDGKRTISVSAAVTRGFNSQAISGDLEEFANNQLNLGPGYSWKTGGVNEENEQSVQSILTAMLLSFLLIVITMVIQFSSFRRAVIVMLVIPLSISGVFIIFAITNTPLSFPALIGILALFGIVVKNSILLVDKIVKNEQSGMEFKRAIADASAKRLEPIALTTICTIIGLIPITLSDPLWRGLGGAIIAGLTFSGTIMLFFIPVVYYFMFRKNKTSHI